MIIGKTLFRLTAATAITGLLLQGAPTPLRAQSPGASETSPRDAPDPPARVGRLADVRGAVSFHGPSDAQWTSAAANYPVASGHSLWTEAGAEASVEVSASRIALAGSTELDVTALDDSGLQAALAEGEAYLRLRALAPGEAWSVQTPRGSVAFNGDGRYLIAAGTTDTPTLVTVLEGAAQVTGPGLDQRVEAGQTATITGTDALQAEIGPAQHDRFLDGILARERPPPARPVPPAVAAIPGGEALSTYGSWAEAPGYGQVWYPEVAPGWVPYRDGHWAYVAPWGWTWIDDAPWGFAPFHYGRWAEVGGRWAWAPGIPPGPAYHRPVYAPALVTFFGIGAGAAVGVGLGAALAARSIGWCPLGPREPYRPWFRASDRYVRAVNVTQVTNINRNVTINNYVNRNAATMVPQDVLQRSSPVRRFAQPVAAPVLAAARPVNGDPAVRPTLATAGVTPATARAMNLTPVPGAPVRPAPGPAIGMQAIRPASPGGPELAAPGFVRPGTNAAALGAPGFGGSRFAAPGAVAPAPGPPGSAAPRPALPGSAIPVPGTPGVGARGFGATGLERAVPPGPGAPGLNQAGTSLPALRPGSPTGGVGQTSVVPAAIAPLRTDPRLQATPQPPNAGQLGQPGNPPRQFPPGFPGPQRPAGQPPVVAGLPARPNLGAQTPGTVTAQPVAPVTRAPFVAGTQTSRTVPPAGTSGPLTPGLPPVTQPLGAQPNGIARPLPQPGPQAARPQLPAQFGAQQPPPHPFAQRPPEMRAPPPAAPFHPPAPQPPSPAVQVQSLQARPAPPPQVHAAPPPQFHAAPPPAPSSNTRQRRPGDPP